MKDIKTVGEAFVKLLEDKGLGEFGKNVFLGEIPLSAGDEAWLVVVSGGNPELVTADGGMMKLYTISLYCRSLSGKKIERELFSLEEDLNTPSCLGLQGFEVIHARTTQFAQDVDLEKEGRRMGVLQTQIRLYKNNH